MPTIAVAIPNLNGEKYLYETLKSLENQIIKPDEIVFSDNSSFDNSLEILKLFPSLSIKVVKPDRFLTMSENWNYVANQTNCDWFFLLSNDDLLRDTAIKRLKEVLSDLEPDIGVISFKSEIIDENSNLVLGKYKFGQPKLRKEYDFLRQNIKFLHINAASVAIRKSSWIDVGRFPQEYMVLHDLVFYQRIVSKWGLLECNDVLGRYRIYRNKPNSEGRTKLALNDFKTYENTDLKLYVRKYPDLLEVYSSRYATDAPSVFKRDSQVISVRMVVLSVMTVCRRMQSRLRHSGFPD